MKIIAYMTSFFVLYIILSAMYPCHFGIYTCCLSYAKRDVTATQISNLEVALDSYRLDMFKYPSSLEELVKNTTNNPKWQGPYLRKARLPKDPWGNDYEYEKGYYLYSFGADGQKGGEGENADVFNWSFDQKKPKKTGFPLLEVIGIITVIILMEALLILYFWKRKNIGFMEGK